MLNSLTIKGFRGFSDFTMSNLGRVNLLVGSNNSGKSSVLEAVQLLCSPGEVSVLWQMAQRRGELLRKSRQSQDNIEEESQLYFMDISHLFHGHHISLVLHR